MVKEVAKFQREGHKLPRFLAKNKHSYPPKIGNMIISLKYRVSHSKVSKVILLWWGYRFQFLLIFWILQVHGIGAFMPNSSVFIFLMLRAPYGSITQHLLFLNEIWIILTFRCLFQVRKSNKPSKIYIFL